jgi:hypothetical protein
MERQVVKSAVLLAAAAGGGILLDGHDPTSTQITWNRELSRIVYKRCASCHHEGGSAFSLMTYKDARPWAKGMKVEVLERRMPPFAAVKGFGDIRDDGGLTQEEIHLVADWVEGGAPEGTDPRLLPKPPDFAETIKREDSKLRVETVVQGAMTLRHATTFVAARAKNLGEGSSIQALAEKPDGTIEAIIWLYNYRTKFDEIYYFRKPLALPAGSKIKTFPANAGSVALLAET